jgi:hypothetical protein
VGRCKVKAANQALLHDDALYAIVHMQRHPSDYPPCVGGNLPQTWRHRAVYCSIHPLACLAATLTAIANSNPTSRLDELLPGPLSRASS